jgi:chorismate-pyruvate lyase
MKRVTKPQWATPDLQSLVDLFYDDASELGHFTEVTAAEMPEDYRELLAHSAHMTVTLESFHKSTLDVHVLNKLVSRNHYSRKITLSLQSDNRIVLFGIVRLNSSMLADDVRAEIESEKIPLGRVLIQHNVLRNVKLLSLWRIEPSAELASLLATAAGQTIYGRTALIYCDSVPAVELLEIVTT